MKKHKLLLAVLPVFPILLTSGAIAQSNGGKGKGLDSLDESAVMDQLATSNLITLLNRDMDNFKVPQAQRDQMATLPLLNQLANPVGLNVAKRHDLAVRVATGLDAILPKQNDSASLSDLANELFAAGVLPTQAEMEYFGENPTTQSQLKPVVETCKKMFQKVELLAGNELNNLGNKIKNAAMFQQLRPQMDKLRMVKFVAEYTDNMAAYSQCLSIPQGPARKDIADPAIKYLSDYDNPQSDVQSIVRLQIGKLQLAEGDYDKAKATLDSIVNNPKNAIVPAPTLDNQNDARYFGIVAEILSRKLPAAEADIAPFAAWQQQDYMPALKPAEQNEIKASLAMLKSRLYSAQADLAADPAVKKAANDKAMEVMSQLLKEQPGLRDLVFDQMIARVPADADLKSLNPLVLQGLEQQGIYEVQKKDGETVDTKKLQRAVDSAVAMIQRKGEPGLVDKDVDTAAYFLGYGYEKLDLEKLAAAAFLDYAQKFNGNKDKDWGNDALDHATKWIGVLRKKDAEDPETRALYDRFLPVAINAPFNRKQFAFGYAKLLLGEHKSKEAVDYFKMVPQTSSEYPEAQFRQMLALYDQLNDPALPVETQKDLVNQMLALDQYVDDLFKNATTDKDKKAYVEWVAIADDICARKARSVLKDYAKSLQILDGFEERIATCKDPATAHSNALQIRVSDYMDMKQIDQATKALLTLLNANAVQGQGLMFAVLKSVSDDMDAAKAAKNVDQERTLADDKAQLSGFIVDWATKNKDPKVVALVAAYQRFDADAKKDAAELIPDPVERKAKLLEALHAYQALVTTTDEQLKLAAQQGIGLVQFDLEDYAEAIKFLAPLVNGHKVGDPVQLTGPAGGQQEVENPQYWQANYELIKSMVELAKKTPKNPKSADDLKQASIYINSLYVLNGKKTGGTTYRDDFDNLRAELAKLVPAPTGAPAPAAAAPAAKPAK